MNGTGTVVRIRIVSLADALALQLRNEGVFPTCSLFHIFIYLYIYIYIPSCICVYVMIFCTCLYVYPTGVFQHHPVYGKFPFLPLHSLDGGQVRMTGFLRSEEGRFSQPQSSGRKCACCRPSRGVQKTQFSVPTDNITEN